jgi:hypothetical protein
MIETADGNERKELRDQQAENRGRQPEKQLERTKVMSRIEFRAKVVSVQSELSIKLEEQTQTCESRVRDLIGLCL